MNTLLNSEFRTLSSSLKGKQEIRLEFIMYDYFFRFHNNFYQI